MAFWVDVVLKYETRLYWFLFEGRKTHYSAFLSVTAVVKVKNITTINAANFLQTVQISVLLFTKNCNVCVCCTLFIK